MIHVLIDSSVLIKWFHSEGESELVEARRLRAAHAAAQIEAHVLDLGLYEIANVLVRSLGWQAHDVANQIDDLLAILGPPLTLGPEGLRSAARLATRHGLTFYDAAWAAAAKSLGALLVSADTQRLGAKLAVTPTQAVRRLGLQ